MTSSPSIWRLDWRVVFEIPLRQFAWWLLVVLVVSVAGFPGVACVTPMAWLIALRVGNFVAGQSRSEGSARRLTEAALAGGVLGFLQGILFGIITPFMGPIQADERTRTVLLVLGMLGVGMLIGAGLAYIPAYLQEQKRRQRTIDLPNH